MISHIHNNNYDTQKPTIKTILYRYVAKKVKHIHLVSKSSFAGYCFHKCKHKVISDAARQRASDLMNLSELKSEIEQQYRRVIDNSDVSHCGHNE